MVVGAALVAERGFAGGAGGALVDALLSLDDVFAVISRAEA